MRIVAGEYRGRTIESPSEKTTRPTTDRVRESMFSSVYSRRADLSATRALDAFAGSGALGLEALSRGAASCTFHERDAEARKVLEGNVVSLGLKSPRAQVRGTDVGQAALSSGGLRAGGAPFGLVLLDPPYALEPARVAAFLGVLAGNGDLEEGCIVVYEHALARRQAALDALSRPESGAFELTGAKKYGKIGVIYLKYAPSGREEE